MKHLKTFEQYTCFPGFKEPDQWDVLKYLSQKGTVCSMAELENIFPNTEETKKALDSLAAKNFIDSEPNGFKLAYDGIEHMKSIPKPVKKVDYNHPSIPRNRYYD